MPNFSSGSILRPYYHGSRRWDDYLIDIQGAVIDLQVNNANANTVTKQQNYHADFDALDLTLNDLSASIDDLATTFEWGLTLLIDGQERQIELLDKIVGQLDVIRKVVQLPSTTKARDLFSLGQNDVKNGFFPEALKKFLAAEEINEVNFPLQLQMGKLLLYGKNKADDVIDLPKAETHLLLAARYAGPGKQWQKYHGEAYFHTGVANYVAAGKMKEEQAPTDIVIACLERAVMYADLALESFTGFSEAHYLRAKCYALLGNRQKTLVELEVLAERDPIGYSAKVNQDKDLDSVRNKVGKVFHPAIEKAKAAQEAARIAAREAEAAQVAAQIRAREISLDVKTITLPARTEMFVPKEAFVQWQSFWGSRKKTGVPFFYVGDFTKYFNKIERPTAETALRSYFLSRQEFVLPMEEAHKDGFATKTTPRELHSLLEMQRYGEKGPLLVNGKENYFEMDNVYGVTCLVWAKRWVKDSDTPYRDWEIGYRVMPIRIWADGVRIFFRDFRSPSTV